MTPYKQNLQNEKGTLFFFNMSIHIIPAKAPIRVKNAEIFELIILAKIPSLETTSKFLIISTYKTLIGILLIKLAITVNHGLILYKNHGQFCTYN